MFLGSFLVNFGVLQSSSVSVEVAIFAVVTGLGAYVSYRGLDASIRVTVFLCAISVPFIAFITFAVANHTGLQLETQFDLSAIDIKAVIQGVATGAVFLVAFESCTSLAAETQNPKKNIPWAVMSVPVVLGATYLLCTFLQTPGLMEVKDEIAAGTSAPAALAHLAGLPSWVGMLTDAVFSLALFASMVGFLNYGARFLMALSSECFLPLAIQSRGNKWGTPGVAIWTLAISGFVVMITPLPGATELKPGSAAKPFFGVKPELVDSDGNVLDGAADGNLCIGDSWPGQMRTVYGDHDRFVKTYFTTFPGRYFTGDGCRRDEDGYYWITGRVDDVLNVSGHRMGTAEIESVLVSHRLVSEAAVVGYPHAIKGQGIYCYVTLMDGEEGSDELRQQLVKHVRTDIGPIAAPDLIQFAPSLPKTRSGKIMRRILRKIAEDDFGSLGDTSTLANPTVIDDLIENRQNRAA